MGAITGGKVAIFGAGGPVGAMAARALKDHYTLRLTDARAIPEIVAKQERQSPQAPLPEVLPPPHECRVVDITDYDQVREAARGMDALVNVAVVRSVLEPAFAVSTIGAYHVAKAAVEMGIRRIIHTGPYHASPDINGSSWWDFDIPAEVPLRPGGDLYAVSKYLGGEITRVFAEQHDLEVITFLYCIFLPGDGGSAEDGSGLYPFTVSWEDCGEAFLYGLRAPSLPRPYEPFFICADLPAGKYRPAKAKDLLGWAPKHRFERLWTRGERG
jgi:nucleoside-diphosphate-sugar epimerase